MDYKDSPSRFQVEEPAARRIPSLNTDIVPQTIVVIGTGGTISCARDPRSGDLVPSHPIDDIIAQAGIPHISHIHVESRDIMALDSSDLQLSDVDHILACLHEGLNDTSYVHPLGGVIIIHGTDTLEETAMAVHCLIDSHVPVILTGAQRPFDDPCPDGPANLRDAFTFALSVPPDATMPAHVVFGGVALPASGVSKAHTHNDRAFVSSSADHGVTRAFSPTPQQRPASLPPSLADLRVEIVSAYGGCSSRVIDAITSDSKPLHGIVVSALGSGNIPRAMVESLCALDVPVRLCTRVPFGPMNAAYGGVGGGAELQRRGLTIESGLRPSQARMKLLCELASGRI
ncbi:asparaginase [Corynebacterium sp. 4HC-13]|uniref:asparaginase domain-containing protein n=1 Tax=Corynebacterium anserum TaxID=2684406 RepID=UPI00163B5B99|nr:asparaginase domain-containing protein [Corynebacterium anserum]MBC2680900.1 asparaginase [Corynebacterium anserum]